jgi:hypothetical protein
MEFLNNLRRFPVLVAGGSRPNLLMHCLLPVNIEALHLNLYLWEMEANLCNLDCPVHGLVNKCCSSTFMMLWMLCAFCYSFILSSGAHLMLSNDLDMHKHRNYEWNSSSNCWGLGVRACLKYWFPKKNVWDTGLWNFEDKG